MFPFSVQTGPPDEQSMAPVRQVFVGEHAAPWLHATQLPPLQTPPGQPVPVPTLPFSTQTPLPDEQSMAPVRHVLAGVQPAPLLHGLQLPPLQTPPAHGVPLFRLPVSVHTALPVEQSMAPERHVADGVQPAPALHGLHEPPRHAPPEHGVPLFFAEPSTHTAEPELHEMVPLRQAELGLVVQPPPSLHALQKPALQTPPEHGVPLPLFEPSTHSGEPDAHETMPFLHAEPGLVVHAPPPEHAEHEPELHTPPAHNVPFIRGAPSMHCCVPVLHE